MAAYPGNYAVPGNMQPGGTLPGQPLTASLGLYQFTGPVPLIYVCYIDAAAGHTLIAVPGQIYDILTPVNNLAAIPLDGLWIPVEG